MNEAQNNATMPGAGIQNAPPDLSPPLSRRRLDAIEDAAASMCDGLDALSSVAGNFAGTSVPARYVNWFARHLSNEAATILRFLDVCEPEPPPVVEVEE